MALVAQTWVKPSREGEHSPSPPSRDVEGVQIFFRLDDAKNVSLSALPNVEIREVKKMLIKKLALLDAATQQPSSQIASASNFVSLIYTLYLAASLFRTNVARWSDLVFLHNGKVLDDDGCVADYMSHGGSRRSYTVHATLRMKGGCFMVSASVFCMLCTAVIGSTCTCGLSLVAVPFLLPLLFVLPLFCL